MTPTTRRLALLAMYKHKNIKKVNYLVRLGSEDNHPHKEGCDE